MYEHTLLTSHSFIAQVTSVVFGNHKQKTFERYDLVDEFFS